MRGVRVGVRVRVRNRVRVTSVCRESPTASLYLSQGLGIRGEGLEVKGYGR